jgi:hypothetical protein
MAGRGCAARLDGRSCHGTDLREVEFIPPRFDTDALFVNHDLRIGQAVMLEQRQDLRVRFVGVDRRLWPAEGRHDSELAGMSAQVHHGLDRRPVRGERIAAAFDDVQGATAVDVAIGD